MTKESVTKRSRTQQRHPPNSNTRDLNQLRGILLGKDYEELLVLKRRLNSQRHFSMQVASVVSEALASRAKKDASLAQVFPPLVEEALTQSIKRDPQQLTDILYPVLGPVVHRSIKDTLSQTLDTVNHLLEQSISPRSLRWRFDAWRSGRSYAEVALLNTLDYRVEQVFLIHAKTGLLLRHVKLQDDFPSLDAKDPDVVSGLLTAIQDFIADAFAVKQGVGLKSMRFGELTVLVEQGPHAFIAAVVRGNVPARLPALLRKTQEGIHGQMKNTLLKYQGDSSPFVRIRPLLERCLLTRTQEKPPGRPILLYLAMGCLLAGLCYWGYQAYTDYQNNSRLQQTEAEQERVKQRILFLLGAEPGIVVVKNQREDGKYYIDGLIDPLAKPPEKVLAALGYNQKTVLNFNSYLSLEPQIVLKRAQQILRPPPGVSLALNDGMLSVSGTANKTWHDRVELLWSTIVGVNALDMSSLRVMSS